MVRVEEGDMLVSRDFGHGTGAAEAEFVVLPAWVLHNCAVETPEYSSAVRPHAGLAEETAHNERFGHPGPLDFDLNQLWVFVQFAEKRRLGLGFVELGQCVTQDLARLVEWTNEGGGMSSGVTKYGLSFVAHGGTGDGISVPERSRKASGTHQAENEAIVKRIFARCAKDRHSRHNEG